MRFHSLRLAPFGVFQDRELAFSPERGLHLVFGPNGAGKSTTLRALRGVLHGFTPRDIAVGRERAELRVGAELSLSSGERLAFTRRTARKTPLYDGADQDPIPVEALAPYLGGLDATEFRNIFGLDLETMKQGGDDLLHGKGEIGRALFGAALGGRLLAETTGRLDRELGELFAPNAQKPRLNQLRREHDEVLKKRNEAMVKPTRYLKDRKELEGLREVNAAGEAERREALAVAARLEAGAAALEVLRELEEVEAARAALGSEAPLEPGLLQRVLGWRDELRDLGQRQDELGRELRSEEALLVERAASRSGIDDELAARIERLLERLDGYREASAALPAAEEARAAAKGAHREARLKAGLTEEEDGAGAGDDAGGDELARTVEDHRARLAAAEAGLEAPDRERRAARALLERRREELEGIESRVGDELAGELQGLAPFRGSLEALAALEVPSADRMAVAIEETEKADEAVRRASESLEQAMGRGAAASAALERLGRDSALPPTQDEIDAARRDRDGQMADLLGRAASGESVDPGDAARVQAEIARVDGLADRRAAEFERAVQRSTHERELEQAGSDRLAAEQRLEAARAEAASCAAGHEALWGGLGAAPDRPAAMLRWLEQRAALLARAEEFRMAARKAVDEARAQVDEREAAHGTARAVLEDARARWGAWAGEQGLDAEAGPAAASAALRSRREVLSARRDLILAEERHAELAARVTAFASEAGELAEAAVLGPVTGDDQAAARAAALRAALESRAKARHLHRSSEETVAALRARDETFAGTAAELETALRDAAGGADALEGFLELAARSGEMAGLDERIRDLGERMKTAGQGAERATIASLPAEGEDHLTAASRLRAEAATYAERAEALLADAGERAERIGALREALSGQDSDAAAKLEARRQQIVAEMEEGAQRYVEARVARALLDREVERYRAATQGPILARAQELFGVLTLGAYERLVAQENDKGDEEMYARRPDGASVPVTGMSEGTRDQLYLALRIASVEHKLGEGAEPMPFIADDLFVNFDDERTEAALRVLAQLAERTQVIVFSHHESVVATCEGLAGDGVPVEVVRLRDEAGRERLRASQDR